MTVADDGTVCVGRGQFLFEKNVFSLQPILQQPDLFGSFGNQFFKLITCVLDRLFRLFASGDLRCQVVVGRLQGTAHGQRPARTGYALR